jgi:hypothetical protein
MGRYYNGDIEGKFWFGIQSSNDADFFGVEGNYYHLEYYFDKEQLPDIKDGIKQCEAKLGKWRPKLDKFFDKNNGYNEDMLEEQIKLQKSDSSKILSWYARLILGLKIKNCVEKHGNCNFQAEL